jgi:hypothetical protein
MAPFLTVSTWLSPGFYSGTLDGTLFSGCRRKGIILFARSDSQCRLREFGQAIRLESPQDGPAHWRTGHFLKNRALQGVAG